MPPDAPVPPLESFRDYLLVLARARLDPRLRGRLDDSDIVQQTLLEAYQGMKEFRGKSSQELAGWLRSILARNLAGALRDLTRHRRDVNRERSLDDVLASAGERLDAWLADEQTPPDVTLQQREDLDRLARAAAELPEDQREAVLLRHFHGWALADIARHTGKSSAAVAGLLHRALTQIRQRMHPTE